jgi:DNA-binding Xre family transcriptional regulator
MKFYGYILISNVYILDTIFKTFIGPFLNPYFSAALALNMTPLGQYLAAKSVNKSEVSRKTGLTKARLNRLSMESTSHLRAQELVLIALAIGVAPTEMLNDLYKNVRLKK